MLKFHLQKKLLIHGILKRLKELVKSVQTDSVDIKMVNYKGDLITGIESLDKKIGLDLIVVGPRSKRHQ